MKKIEVIIRKSKFDEVKEADWVVEAVVERIDIKHDIYKKIFKLYNAQTKEKKNHSLNSGEQCIIASRLKLYFQLWHPKHVLGAFILPETIKYIYRI